jgi:hypothetical protein
MKTFSTFKILYKHRELPLHEIGSTSDTNLFEIVTITCYHYS